MQSRYRNSNDGFRPRPSFAQNRYRGGSSGSGGGFNRSYSKPYNNRTPPASRKSEILMEAGRLAAEYLVSKGVLSPNVLPANLSNATSIREFHGQGRENSYQPQFRGEGRPSALARLGDSDSDAGYRKRRFDDEYDQQGSQRNGRERMKMGYYSRGYGSEWGRGRERNDSWNERNRGYSDGMEDVDDFALGYRRERQVGNDDVGSSISRVAGEEQHSKTEAVGESGSELDDTGSKASSNSMKKDAAPEMDADLSNEMDESKTLNVETGEMKNGESSDLDKKTAPGEEGNSLSGGNRDESVTNNPCEPLKIYDFAKVPRRPRSLVAHRTADKGPDTGVSEKVGYALGGESEIAAVAAPLKDSPMVGDNGSNCEVPAISVNAIATSSKETADQQSELEEKLQHVEPPMMTIDEANMDAEQQEPEREVNSTPDRTSQEDEFTQPGRGMPAGTGMVQDAGTIETPIVEDMPSMNLGATETTSAKEMPSLDFDMMEAMNQLKPTLVAKAEVNPCARLQQENHKLPESFKICDLNFMETPEITEIPDDTEAPRISSSPFETGDKLPVDFGPSASIKAKNTCKYNHPPDEKVVTVIDLEDDYPTEVNASCDTTKPKNEMVYSSLKNVLNEETHTDDLQAMQDNYSLVISDYLGTEMSCSSSVQADLNNLQSGMGLPGPEGFPGVDDAIYGSLSDIGFMEVWDQPAHEYEKFF